MWYKDRPASEYSWSSRIIKNISLYSVSKYYTKKLRAYSMGQNKIKSSYGSKNAYSPVTALKVGENANSYGWKKFLIDEIWHSIIFIKPFNNIMLLGLV